MIQKRGYSGDSRQGFKFHLKVCFWICIEGSGFNGEGFRGVGALDFWGLERRISNFLSLTLRQAWQGLLGFRHWDVRLKGLRFGILGSEASDLGGKH